MNRKRRNELFLIAGLLLIAILCLGFNRLMAAQSAVTVEVSAKGQTIASYPLDEDTTQMINGTKGGINHLMIKDGGVSITEASCPDKVCVHQGVIKESGQTLVCLPNKVVITIK